MLTFPPFQGIPSLLQQPGQLSGLPAVTRATGLIAGLIRQMSMDAYTGPRKLPRPRFLHRPDPSPGSGRAWWVGQHVTDYLIHGNCVHLVTSRHESGLPASAVWLPAQRVGITPTGAGLLSPVEYWLDGTKLQTADVVHVRRGADPNLPARGVGVVEQHLATFGKLQRQQRYEEEAYSSSGVPSVAVITPNSGLSQTQADDAKASWMEKFERREPVILPQGTTVTPLSWSPTDAQMVEAHEMSLGDVALMFNMDGAWLGAATKGMTYKSIGPLFLGLVRETIDPITDDLEQVWGDAWLHLGEDLHFTKQEILGDDMATEMAWISQGVEKKLISIDEGRERLGYSPRGGEEEISSGGDDLAREAAEISQKVYLAVANDVIDRDEARDLIRRGGANLKGNTDE